MTVILIIFLAVDAGSALAADAVAEDVTNDTIDQNAETEMIVREGIFAASDKAVRKLTTVTDGQSCIDHEAVDMMMQMVVGNYSNSVSSVETVSSDYSIIVSKLNLALVLSSADGLSIIQTAPMLKDGMAALVSANGNDSYRHFTWSFNSTKNLDYKSADIFTTNYEWADYLLDNYDDYKMERYNYYFNIYYSSIVSGTIDSSVILNMATADADDYIVAFRDSTIATCKKSYDNFVAVFNQKSSIMDLWNNYYGRLYARNYGSLDAGDAYNLAVSNGVIILDADKVDKDDIARVYNNGWWHS